MKIKDVIEWMQIADEDFDSAQILNGAYRKHYEIICYHCAQSIEKYLKGYLAYHDIIPQKTHNLSLLNDNCVNIDCHFMEIYEEDVNYALHAVEKIRNFEPIKNIRNMVHEKTNQ